MAKNRVVAHTRARKAGHGSYSESGETCRFFVGGDGKTFLLKPEF